MSDHVLALGALTIYPNGLHMGRFELSLWHHPRGDPRIFSIEREVALPGKLHFPGGPLPWRTTARSTLTSLPGGRWWQEPLRPLRPPTSPRRPPPPPRPS
jgi:hypothetical protein